jgi:peptidoglycan/LPS O-acetylase OafA/YrhL
MQTNDVLAVGVGTVLWIGFLVALVPLQGTLRRNGLLWWYPMAVCGFALGLLGLYVTRRRRDREPRDPVAAGEDMPSPPA